MLLKYVPFRIYKCQCKVCGNTFEVYKLSDFSYGERLLLTEDGLDFGYIVCYEDSVFNEVSTIVENFCKPKNLKQNQIVDCFNKVFGISCDLINGKKIDAYRSKRACPDCKKDQLETTPYEPFKTITAKVPVITHDEWNKLSSIEKNDLVFKELNLKGCI